MDLHYQAYGDGFPLLILHGLLGASGNWHTLGRTRFGKHFRTFALDQRNHGRSPHSEAFGYDVMAEDVADFMAQRDLDAAHLLGHSMGGKTAMRAALEHPDQIEKLVVVDIAPKAYPPHHEPIFAALRGLELSAYESREAIDAALAEDIASWPVRQFLLKNLSLDGQGGYTWQMNLESIYASYEAISGAVDVEGIFEGPALFVRGANSDYVADDDLAAIHENFPRASLETIEGAGHWVHADQPEAFADVVLDFLQG